MFVLCFWIVWYHVVLIVTSLSYWTNMVFIINVFNKLFTSWVAVQWSIKLLFRGFQHYFNSSIGLWVLHMSVYCFCTLHGSFFFFLILIILGNFVYYTVFLFINENWCIVWAVTWLNACLTFVFADIMILVCVIFA